MKKTFYHNFPVLALPMLVFLLSVVLPNTPLYAQSILVSGEVRSQDNETLPGTSVKIKGTTTGVVTDIQGQYTINVSANDTLVFSYVGMLSEEIPVLGRSTIDVMLISDIKALLEVVVIGYQTVKKKDLTGSVVSIKEEELTRMPILNSAEAIIGRLVGVQVATAEGAPGAENKIRIRGGGSITQDNSPLYIVDGFPMENALALIAPQEIASIDVLKDASSTAIYGARGANGVVVITTKSGRAGKANVSYDVFYGFKKLPKKLEVLSPYEYVVSAYERVKINGNPDRFRSFVNKFGSFTDYQRLYGEAQGNDWQQELFGRTAMTKTHSVGFNGGNETTKYNIGYTRNMDEGIMVGTGYDRNLISLKLNQEISKKLTLNAAARYNQEEFHGVGTSGEGSESDNRLRNVIQYRPIIPANLDPNSELSDIDLMESKGIYDPISIARQEVRERDRKILNVSGSVAYKILPDLTFNSLFGFENRTEEIQDYNGPKSFNARVQGGPIASIFTMQQQRLNNTYTLIYNKKLNEAHNITGLLGYEYIMGNGRSIEVATYQLPVSLSPEKALASLETGLLPQKPMSNVFMPDRWMSYFGRVGYDYKDKYLLRATLRSDGSSKFGPQYRWGLFPSAAVAWRLSEENFLKNVQSINDLKIRATWGMAGNDRIGSGLWRSQYQSSRDAGYELGGMVQPGLMPASLANPYVKWEATISQNVGLDASLFKGRLNVTADVYQTITKDLLLASTIPMETGFTTQIQNIGSTRNRGVELVLSGVVLDKGGFRWDASFNIAANRNVVLSLTDGVDYFRANSDWSTEGEEGKNDFIVKVGQPVGLMYGYKYDGFYTVDDFDYDPTTQRYTVKDGVPRYNFFGGPVQPGDPKYRDIELELDENGNPIINANDKTVIGNATPKHFGGFTNTFTYKGFDLSVFMNWTYGNDIYNANKIDFTSGKWEETNLLAEMNNRWRTIDNEGSIVTNPDQLRELNKNATVFRLNSRRRVLSSWAVEDGSFLRVNNVTLGYTLPKSITEKAKMERVRIYATGYNLHVFTNYSGYDPEVDTRRITPLTPNVDYSAYPKSRSLIIGANITF